MKKNHFIYFSLLVLILSSCTKDKKYQYEVNTVNVSQQMGDKNNQKTANEFISIAYSDLFGTTIPQTKLVNLSIAYTAFGDYKLIEDRIIRNFLNDTACHVPAQLSVSGDTGLFISNTYKKFYNRNPTELETHYWKEEIRTNTAVSSIMVYYALMTSDEYRYY